MIEIPLLTAKKQQYVFLLAGQILSLLDLLITY
jgi:hypothetical protein